MDGSSGVVVKLESSSAIYRMVQESFLIPLRQYDPQATVTQIHRCSFAITHGLSRLQAFDRTEKIVHSKRGISNVRCGWYGTDALTMGRILLRGFQDMDAGRSMTIGNGLHVWAQGQAHMSAFDSVTDAIGENHVFLCHVIMGAVEQIEQHCQSRPTSENFDSGVNSLSNPTCHVIWKDRMNTHVLPEYVISFRISKSLQEKWKTIKEMRAVIFSRGLESDNPQEANSLSKTLLGELFAGLRAHLPEESMEIILNACKECKAGAIEKAEFFKLIRSIAGPQLLFEILKSISFNLPKD